MNKLKSKFNKIDTFSSFLFILIPLGLITGPFIPDFFLVIISLLFLFKVLSSKYYNIFKIRFILFFYIFYLIIILSSFLSEYASYSLKSSIPYLRFGLFSLATYLLFLYNKKIAKYLTYVFLIILFALFIDSLIEFIFNKNIFGWKKVDSNFRITSFFGEDEVLGSYIARFFPFIISLIFFSKQEFKLKINNLQIFFVIVVSFLITFISGERTSLVLIVISIFLMLVSCKDLRKIISISMLTILFLSSTLILYKPKLKERFYDQIISQMNLNNSDERTRVFSKEYEGHYIIAYRMFKEKPLLGHGVKSFRKYCSKPENYLYERACTTHPHNIYMQLLSETGIFSFFIILFCFIFSGVNILRLAFKNFNNKNLLIQSKILLYIFFFVNLFPLIPSGNLFNNWISVIYFMPVGFFIYMNNYKIK